MHVHYVVKCIRLTVASFTVFEKDHLHSQKNKKLNTPYTRKNSRKEKG